MSIHVCKCIYNGREEYHLRYPGMTEAEAQDLADRINGGGLQPKQKTGGLADAIKAARGGDAPVQLKGYA